MTNPFGRTAHEQAEYERAVWPGSEVLRSKLGIREQDELELAERFFVGQRLRKGFPTEITPNTYEGFLAIHRHRFQDLFEWAGENRRYTTNRNPHAAFARPQFIRPWMEQQFAVLETLNYLKSTNAHDFAGEAAPLVNEINAAHP